MRAGGSGPPVLLHGFPETHLMWRDVAPILARRFTVVRADLRGGAGVDGGHFFPEENPGATAAALEEFFLAP